MKRTVHAVNEIPSEPPLPPLSTTRTTCARVCTSVNDVPICITAILFSIYLVLICSLKNLHTCQPAQPKTTKSTACAREWMSTLDVPLLGGRGVDLYQEKKCKILSPHVFQTSKVHKRKQNITFPFYTRSLPILNPTRAQPRNPCTGRQPQVHTLQVPGYHVCIKTTDQH